MSEPQIVLELDGLKQVLRDPGSGETFTVLVETPIRIPAGSFAAILGPSGCGKTTLLSVLGLLRAPTEVSMLGSFVLRCRTADGSWTDHDIKAIWSGKRRSSIETLRRKQIGFALQNGELLSSLTVSENIAVPLRLNGLSRREAEGRTDELMVAFRLKSNADIKGSRSLAYQRTNRLSGGEYQRVALARAIAHRPTLVFVDEPTSALNRELAFGALNQLRELYCGPNPCGAVVMITHDEELAAMFADVVIRMAPRKGQPIGEVVSVESRVPHIRESVHADEQGQGLS